MGREIAIACIPCACMSEIRIQELHRIVDCTPVCELESDSAHLPDANDEAELRSVLHSYIDLVAESEDRWRDVNHICYPDFPYTLLATGGDSWGEPPSETYVAFEVVDDCDPLRRQLEVWARDDSVHQQCNSGESNNGPIDDVHEIESPDFVIVDGPCDDKPRKPKAPEPPFKSSPDSVIAQNMRIVTATYIAQPVVSDGEVTGKWQVFLRRDDRKFDFWEDVPWEATVDGRDAAYAWAESHKDAP